MRRDMLLPLMLAGYLFLLIFRPYEYWPVLGDFRLERVYMLTFMAAAFFVPGKRLPSSPVHLAVGALALTLLVSALGAYNGQAAWRTVEDYLKYIVFYVMLILSVRNERDFRFVLLAFVAVMGLYVGKSMWEFFVHGRHVYRMGIRRMVGIDVTYGDPNSFAASIAYSLPLFWALVRCRFPSVWVRRGLWLYGGMALVGIIFTGSRSGMVTAIFFALLVLMSSSRKLVGIFVVFLLLVFAWDFMPDDLQQRFLSTFGYGHTGKGAIESAEGRLKGFQQGMEVFTRYPLLGIGPGNFGYSWEGLSSGPKSHNVYGEVAGELGLAGILSFGGLVVVLFRQNILLRRRCRLLLSHPALLRSARRNVHDRSTPVRSPAAARDGGGSNGARYSMKNHVPPAEDNVSTRHGYALKATQQETGEAPYRMKPLPDTPETAGSAPADRTVPQTLAADRHTPQPRPVQAQRRKARAGAGAGGLAGGDLPGSLMFYSLVAQAVMQTLLLMLFKGWGDHNLYRYTWLWLGGVTVLGNFLFAQEVRRHGRS
ncbi:O-antigen polymerase [Oleidesulfovibrio alaskensis G20]|jgi:O-antigen ligase|uniref:O-antigen polymerase n=1 Tax=Oleidesulfovibrio alaskensis (strain ATCC BAA-1058 / DSM 17464 / G20) TaxID=207559 RepID=Q314K0_OLEA2|nr:O-antigen ligase family protein [Oleidesulfovibrio alaskensis]ABB37646.1 O-antigen polymerase [Oleidesulfovibrio alaskensis G20]MBG0773567.1 O-antigen ligase family protein [Oleidesulfovibrio alaskensis]